MAAVARMTRNLSQERATILAKEAIELSDAGKFEVRDNSSLCLIAHAVRWFGLRSEILDDWTRRHPRVTFF